MRCLIKVIFGILFMLIIAPFIYAKSPDFDSDGIVGLSDYFLFADEFGKDVNEINNKFDLNDDNKINFDDFFIFADDFGKEIESEKKEIKTEEVTFEESLNELGEIL